MKKSRYLWIILGSVLILPVLRSTAAVFDELTAKNWQPKHDLLHAVRKGSGPDAVLFLHGLAGTSSYFGNRFGEIPDRFSYHAVDLLGFGDSPKPKGTYDTAMHRQAVELYINTAIMPENPRSIALFTHSMGALIGLDLIRHHPDLFSRAVMIGTPLYPDQKSARENIGHAGMMYKAMVDDNMFMSASCFFRDSYRLPFLAPFFNLPKDVYLDATRHSWSSLYGSLRNTVMNVDAQQYQDLNGAKIQFVHAADDEIAPLETAQAFAGKISSSLTVLPTGGHQVFLTDPDRFLRILDESGEFR